MNFLKLFLRGIALLPSLIQGVETLYGAKTGLEKKAAVMEIVDAAIKLPDAIANNTIVDPASFDSGLSGVVDGIVQCLDASVWAKQQTAPAVAPAPAKEATVAN